MGDRGNIKCVADGHTIYFYSHWSGSDLPNLLREALIKGKSRWSNGPYLNRVIFQTMLDGDTGETGFAIWGSVCDNEHPIITVDHDSKTVEISGKTWTFAEYIQIAHDAQGGGIADAGRLQDGPRRSLDRQFDIEVVVAAQFGDHRPDQTTER